MRLGYGPDAIYTRSAQRSLQLWEEFFAEFDSPTPLFHRTGVLWLAREPDAYCEATLTNLLAAGARTERLRQAELRERFSQMQFDGVDWAILERDAGVLMARRAVQAVALRARANGVDYFEEAIAAPINGRTLRTTAGREIVAEHVVFACGPWLPNCFPNCSANGFTSRNRKSSFSACRPAMISSSRLNSRRRSTSPSSSTECPHSTDARQDRD